MAPSNCCGQLRFNFRCSERRRGFNGINLRTHTSCNIKWSSDVRLREISLTFLSKRADQPEAAVGKDIASSKRPAAKMGADGL